MKKKVFLETLEASKQFVKDYDAVWLEVRGLKNVNLYVPKWNKALTPMNEVMFLAYLPELRAKDYNVLWRTWKRMPTEEERMKTMWHYEDEE